MALQALCEQGDSGNEHMWELGNYRPDQKHQQLGEKEDEVISRLRKLAAVCTAQTNLASERSGLPVGHYFNLCLVAEEQVTELSHTLENLFCWLEQNID